MTKQQRMKAELKVVRSLKYWEDADLGIESNRELIALVIYRELLDELNKKDERGL